ncbi:MAG: CvpA family protein [Acidisphaera sp.]|nr:CvpA family protein [Acidisphaera sp.]
MTWVDGLVLIVLGASALLAFMRGLVREALGILAWIGAAYAALAGYAELQPTVGKYVQNPDFAEPIAFGIIFLVVLIAGSIVARLLSRLVRRSPLAGVDRTLGLVFGLLRGAALVVVAYIGAGMLMPVDEWPEPVLHARVLPYAYYGAKAVVDKLPPGDRPRVYPPPGGTPSTQALLQRQQ